MRGALWIVLASLVGATMTALIKHVGQRIPVVEILFVRQFIVIAILTPVLVHHRRTVFKTEVMRYHVLRGVFGAIAMTTGFTAMVHLPLAEATAISFAKTLFMTLLAIVFLGEKVGIRRWSVTIIGFIGVLIIIRPDTDNVNAYALLALLSSMFVAGIMILLKKLARTEPSATIMIYQSMFVTGLLVGPAIYFWVAPTWLELGLILIIGLLMSMMQWLMIQGLKAAEAVAVAPVEYLRLLFATAIGIVVFAEIPTVWTVAGSAIIIGSTFYTIRRNAKRKKVGEGG